MRYALLSILAAVSIHAQTLDQRIDRVLPSLLNLYTSLHAAPELSMQEAKTSATLAQQLRDAGFTVTEHVGKYQGANATGYGVVAVMKNGNDPTVLVRSDMDALPVTEQTGLPYAAPGPVMHARGHDIHLPTLAR